MKRTRQNQVKSTSKSKSRKASKKASMETANQQQNESLCMTDGPQASNEKSVGERPVSPDPNCTICLCKMDDKSFTNSCFHMFCFTCLLEWSKVKAVCPLCKQSFKSIIHNIRSERDYDIYNLRENGPPPVTDTDDSLPPELTMLEHERYPVYPWHNLVTPFEYLPQLFAATPPTWLQFHNVILSESNRLRRIYHAGQRMPEMQHSDGNGYRDLSPEYFIANLDGYHVHQIRTWLSHELDVLRPLGSHRHLKRLIMNLLTRFPIQSDDFYERLHVFFGDGTRSFVDELYDFARSSLSVTNADRQTVYDASNSNDVEVITLDRDDSDIEIISPPEKNADSNNLLLHSPRSNSSDNAFSASVSLDRGITSGSIEAENRDGVSPVACFSGFLRGGYCSTPSNDEILGCSPEPLVEEVDGNESSSTSIYDNEVMFLGIEKPCEARTPIFLSSDDSDIDVDNDRDMRLVASPRKSPFSEELLELDLPQSNNSTQMEDSRRFGSEEGCSCSSAWSNFESGELFERADVKRLRCCYQDYDPLDSSSDNCNPEVDFGCNCNHKNGKSYTFQKCFDRCCFRGDRLSHMQRVACDSRCCDGHDRSYPLRKKVLKSRRSRNKRRMRSKLRRSMKKHHRKRRHEDCDGSGMTDVKLYNKGTRDVENVSYKKHCRGHKKSLRRMKPATYDAEETRAGGLTDGGMTTLVLNNQDVDAGHVAMDSKHNVVMALNHEATIFHNQGLDSVEQNEREEVLDMKKPRKSSELTFADYRSDLCKSSNSETVLKEDSGSLNPCANSESNFPTESPKNDSNTNDALPAHSSRTISIIGNLDMMLPLSEPDTESVDLDSEDSVQCLDLEKPDSEMKDCKQCSPLSSGRFAHLSDAFNPDIFQVSDDEGSSRNFCDSCCNMSSKDPVEHVSFGVINVNSPAVTSCDLEDPGKSNHAKHMDNSLNAVCGDIELGDDDRQPCENVSDLDVKKYRLNHNDFIDRINDEVTFGEVETTEDDKKI